MAGVGFDAPVDLEAAAAEGAQSSQLPVIDRVVPPRPLKSVPWATRYESSAGRRSRFTEVDSRRVALSRDGQKGVLGGQGCYVSHLA